MPGEKDIIIITAIFGSLLNMSFFSSAWVEDLLNLQKSQQVHLKTTSSHFHKNARNDIIWYEIKEGCKMLLVVIFLAISDFVFSRPHWPDSLESFFKKKKNISTLKIYYKYREANHLRY